VATIKERLVGFFEKDMVEEVVVVPYAKGALIGEIRRTMRVLDEQHDNEGTRMRVRALPEDLQRLNKSIKSVG
jgi:GTP-binding protein HflX